MAVSSVGSDMYSSIASGSALSSAASNPSGLVISEELKSQQTGYDVASDNASAGQDVLKTAEGGLSNIMDSLQRIRELSVQASSTALYTPDDISSMQDEIDQLKQSIQESAKGTQFNTMNLLDGSMADMNLATDPNGGSTKIQLANTTLESLGIEDFDVTGSFSLDQIDQAIEKVSTAQSQVGAQSNALDTIISNNSNSSYNLSSANSKIEDLDVPKAISEQKIDEVIEEYRLHLQEKIQEQKKTETENLLNQ